MIAKQNSPKRRSASPIRESPIPPDTYDNVSRLIELEEIKDNKVMSKAIKTMLMFNKKLTQIEPDQGTESKEHSFLISPQRVVRYHLEHGRRLREKASPQKSPP